MPPLKKKSVRANHAWLFIKPGIQEWGTECGECRERAECSLGFWGNLVENSGECSRRFRGMLLKIPANVIKDYGECSRRFRGMFKKIPRNVIKDSGNVPEDSGNVQVDSGEFSRR